MNREDLQFVVFSMLPINLMSVATNSESENPGTKMRKAAGPKPGSLPAIILNECDEASLKATLELRSY